MIRKILCVLFCLSLMLGIMPVLAEETATPTLFRLMDVSEDGSERLMGTAVLFSDQETLLTTIWAMQYSGSIRVIGPDGEYGLLDAVRVTENSELAVLSLDRPCESAQPLQLLSSGGTDDMALVLGCSANGQDCAAVQNSVSPALYGDIDAGLVAAPSGLAPGAIVLDANGQLSGMVMASWGEKPGHYAAMTRSAMAQDFIALLEAAAAVDNWLDAPVLSYAGGALTVDWSAEMQTDENSQMHVYLVDEDNSFYSWYLISGARTSAKLPVVPGRSYGIWIQHSQTEERDWNSSPSAPAARIAIPDAQPLTAHGFQSLNCYLAIVPAVKEPDATTPLPQPERITAQMLEDESLRLYFQAVDTYQVEEEIETTLVIAFTTPDGQCFSLDSGYIYMPSLNGQDCWNTDITHLIRYVLDMGNGFAPGEYVLSYYIGGELAGENRFVLE